MIEKERAEFETWCKSIGFTVDKNCFGEYRYGYGHELYSGWQASAARYQSRIEELEVEVVRLNARLVDKGMTAEDKARNYTNNQNADAERYQWLERNAQVEWDLSYESVQVSFTAPESLCAIESLSAAIDEAMKGGE